MDSRPFSSRPFQALLLAILLCIGVDYGVSRSFLRFWVPFADAPEKSVLEAFRVSEETFDLIAIGSSRTRSGFSAGFLQKLAGKDGIPLKAFNLSILGSRVPFFAELLHWIIDSVRAPQILLVEIDPILLTDHGGIYEEWVRYYASTPHLLGEILARSHLTAAVAALAGGMGQFLGRIVQAPARSPVDPEAERVLHDHGDRYGPLVEEEFPHFKRELKEGIKDFRENRIVLELEKKLGRPLTDEEVLEARLQWREGILGGILRGFRIPSRVRADLLDLVQTAESAGIQVVFYRPPLNRIVFPDLYSPEIEQEFRKLQKEVLAGGAAIWLDTGIEGLRGRIRTKSPSGMVQEFFRDGVDHLGGEGCRQFTIWLYRQLGRKGLLERS
ncbi:MAG: hypothetical protein ACE5H3_13000 [Planctomycetota bacterium]